MPAFDRLTKDSDWIDLEFMERRRTPEGIVEVDIQLHLAGLSLSNTKQHLERLGVQRSRTAIHNWVQKADVQPTGTRSSCYVAVDETVIQLGTDRYWLYAAVDAKSNEFLHVRLFPTTNAGLTQVFLRELSEKIDRFHSFWRGSHSSAKRWLRRFRHYYNRHRPNQALDGSTPAQEVLN